MLKKPINLLEKLSGGMVLSPFEGFPQVRGIDFHSLKGIAQIERAPVALTTSGTAISRGLWTITINTGVVYILDSNGRLFTTTVGATTYSQVTGTGQSTTNASGNGLVFWKGHIIVVRDQIVDAYKLSNATWYELGTLTNSRPNLPNPAFVGQDDIVYIGNGKNIASITENSGQTFDASNAATFTFANGVLSGGLPQDYAVNSFAELNNDLAIGTLFGTSSDQPNKTADIFPWSRNTAEGVNLPIRIGDEGINSLLTSNNLLTISAGLKGNIYISNGVSVSDPFSTPLDSKENAGDSVIVRFPVYPDAMDYLGNELLIGITQNSSGSVPAHNPIGVYGYLKGAFRFLGNGSYNKDGSDGTKVRITSVYSISPSVFYVCWWSGSTTGIDYYGPENNRISSHSNAYMISNVFILGTDKEPAKLETFDFYLGENLAIGDEIKLQYRNGNSGSWIDIATLDFVTYGAISHWNFDYPIDNIKAIQFKTSMLATGTTSPKLASILAQ